MSVIDTFRHKGMRKQLVKEIRSKGITDEKVIQAIEKIPRHCFVDKLSSRTLMESAFISMIYEDKAFPIGEGQTISQPYTVAFQTQLLNLQKGDKVLEIGTGSGYQTAVLLELGAKVFTVERQKALFDKTKKYLPALGYDPFKMPLRLFFGDGYLGLPAFAPFDKILVTAGAPFIPEPLKQQLKPGGILVIPVGEGETQTMFRISKISETEFSTEEQGLFRFVPLLENKEGMANSKPKF